MSCYFASFNSKYSPRYFDINTLITLYLSVKVKFEIKWGLVHTAIIGEPASRVSVLQQQF
jgi:hypothetical protein